MLSRKIGTTARRKRKAPSNNNVSVVAVKNVAKARIGKQLPRIKIEPERITSDGYDASLLTEYYGMTLDQWQCVILDGMLARNENDEYASTSVGISVPRQNGKNGVLEARELYGTVICGEKILHTAHQGTTARKAFLRMCQLIDGHNELNEKVSVIHRSNGAEAIYFKNGASIEYASRTSGGSRGWSVDVVVFDEAGFLKDEHVEAIMSTLAAAPSGSRQLIYAGTPPVKYSDGPVFYRVREQALTNPGTSAWYEWSVDSDNVSKIDTSNVDLWYDTNPAMGIRLTEDFTREEFRTLSQEGFARERLGYWRPLNSNVDAVIPFILWDECKASQEYSSTVKGKTFFSVRFSGDGKCYTITAAIVDAKTGKTYVEVICGSSSMNKGVKPIAEWLWARLGNCDGIIIDGFSHASTLVNFLNCYRDDKRNGYKDYKRIGECYTPTTYEMIEACGTLFDSVINKDILHADQPGSDLAIKTSDKRKIGNRGGWGYGGEYADVVEGIALARWYATKMTAKKEKRVRIA